MLMAMLPVALAAQAAPAGKGSGSFDYAERWDMFVGYSYLAPHGTVQVPQPNGTTEPFNYRSINDGEIISIAYFFNKYVGAEISGDMHLQDENWVGTVVPRNSNDFNGGSLGMIVRLPSSTVTPFAHAAVGGEYAAGPYGEKDQWGPVLTVGGGLDYLTPLYHHRIAIRLFQADYQFVHEDYGQVVYGGRGNPNIARLSAGVLFKFGSIAPPTPITVACSAAPTSVFPGTPVIVTATAGNLDPKLNTIYSFSGNGIVVAANGAMGTIKTDTLAPATYTVACGAKEGKPGKEGLQPWENAEGSTTFIVKPWEKPTATCVVDRTSPNLYDSCAYHQPQPPLPGQTSTITATGNSPQNLPLTFAITGPSLGPVSVTGNTATATYSPTSVDAATFTCTVTDDKGGSASATTAPVTAVAPPACVNPGPHKVPCTIAFTTDKKRPTRVDNEAKACLDQVAIDLKEPGNKIYIVGESTAAEKELPKHHKKNAKVEDFASERAVNTQDYLVKDSGADGSRITLVTGPADSQQVEVYLLKPDERDDFSTMVPGTQPADTSVKVTARKAITQDQYDLATNPKPKPHHKKAAAKPAAGTQ
jgi:hypothetical protein